MMYRMCITTSNSLEFKKNNASSSKTHIYLNTKASAQFAEAFVYVNDASLEIILSLLFSLIVCFQ